MAWLVDQLHNDITRTVVNSTTDSDVQHEPSPSSVEPTMPRDSTGNFASNYAKVCDMVLQEGLASHLHTKYDSVIGKKLIQFKWIASVRHRPS